MKSDSTFHIDDVKIEGVLVSGDHAGSDPSQKPMEVKCESMAMEVTESVNGGPSDISRLEEQKSHVDERINDKVDCTFQSPADVVATQQIKVKEFACFACEFKDGRMEVVVQHILSAHPSPQVKTASLVLVQAPNPVAIPSNQQMQVAENEPAVASFNNVAVPELPVKIEVKNEPGNNPLHLKVNEIQSECTSDPSEVPSTVSSGSDSDKNYAGLSCKICSHVFTSNVDAELHMRCHWDPLGPVGTKRFPCIVCDFRTKEKSCLTRHLLTHFGRKPFACDVCGARFNRKDSLMKHLRTHTRMKQVGTNKPENESCMVVGTSLEHTSFSSDYESNNATDVAHPGSSHVGTTTQLGGTPNLVTAFGGFDGNVTLNTSDVVMSNIQTETSEDPDPCEPPSDPLKMDQTEEQSLDSNPSSYHGLRLAESTSNGSSKAFRCEFCGYENRKKSDFTIHMRTHTGETPFACDFCDKRYIAKKTLNRHIKKAHPLEEAQFMRSVASSGEKDPLDFHPEQSNSYLSGDDPDDPASAEGSFACDFCDNKYNTESSMDGHINESHGHSWFSCSLCHYKSKKRLDLTEHVKTHIASDIGPQIRIETAKIEADEVKPSSDLELNELSNNSGPSESTQPGNDPWGAEFDDNYEPTNESFQLELSNEHSQDSGVSRSSSEMTWCSKNKRWTCEICGYKTSRKYEYTVHMRTHTGEKPYKCSLCDYRTVRKSYVAKHMKTHKGAKTVTSVSVECDSPEMRDGNGLSGNTPGRSLSEDEHFSCEHCDYECDGITAWSQHMFEHTNEKSRNCPTYSCENCDYKTKYKWEMDEHRSKHVVGQQGAVVKITCEFCDYGFISKDDMSQHIRTIHPEKCPHSCDKCDFKAFNVRGLEWHMETHAKPFACSLCDFRVEEESSLSNHLLTAHGDVEQYVCYSCDFKASTVADVEQHILTTHSLPAETAPYVLAEAPAVIDPSVLPQPQEYLCYACDFKATELAEVESHIVVSHPTPVVQEVAVPLVDGKPEIPDFTAPSNTGEFTCLNCEYKASSVVELEQHIQTSHNPTSESTA